MNININKIESNLFGHFKYLPKILGFDVKQTPEATIIDTGLASSMFNIVCEVHLTEQSLNQSIENIIKAYKGQNFAFWLGPSSEPINLGQELQKHGFIKETNEHAMICDLSIIKPTNSLLKKLKIKLVDSIKLLQDFISILEVYDSSARTFYEQIINPALSIKEKLFVGYEGETPVIIAIIYLNKDIAGIFSLLTKEEARGKGYGNEMMIHLMNFAKQNGATYASLSASSDNGFRIYERLGFKTVGIFECLEWRE